MYIYNMSQFLIIILYIILFILALYGLIILISLFTHKIKIIYIPKIIDTTIIHPASI